MKPTPDSQLIKTLAAALEPAVIKAVERAVKEVFLGKSKAPLGKTIEKTAREVFQKHAP